MEFKEAVNKRRSIRGYKNTPISKETIKDILTTACRCTNAKNYQPWEFAVITGEPLKKLGEMNVNLFKENAEKDMGGATLDGIYKKRAVELGIDLFKVMDITREDKEKRMWWSERGYRFFDAPALILIMMDESADQGMYRLDIGSVIQNICLAATDKGLGTCVEYQATEYHNHYYDYLNIPKNKHFICGISIGEIDPSFAANDYISKREDVDDITTWVGF